MAYGDDIVAGLGQWAMSDEERRRRIKEGMPPVELPPPPGPPQIETAGELPFDVASFWDRFRRGGKNKDEMLGGGGSGGSFPNPFRGSDEPKSLNKLYVPDYDPTYDRQRGAPANSNWRKLSEGGLDQPRYASSVPNPETWGTLGQTPPEESLWDKFAGFAKGVTPPEVRGKIAGAAAAPGWLAENASNASAMRDYTEHARAGEYFKLPMDFLGGIPGLGTAVGVGAKALAAAPDTLGAIFLGIPTLSKMGMSEGNLLRKQKELQGMPLAEREATFSENSPFFLGKDNKLQAEIQDVAKVGEFETKRPRLERLSKEGEQSFFRLADETPETKDIGGAFMINHPNLPDLHKLLELPPITISPRARMLGYDPGNTAGFDRQTGRIAVAGMPGDFTKFLSGRLRGTEDSVIADVLHEVQHGSQKVSGTTRGFNASLSPYTDAFWKMLNQDPSMSKNDAVVEAVIRGIQEGKVTPQANSVLDKLYGLIAGENSANAAALRFAHWPRYNNIVPTRTPGTAPFEQQLLTEDLLKGTRFEKP